MVTSTCGRAWVSQSVTSYRRPEAYFISYPLATYPGSCGIVPIRKSDVIVVTDGERILASVTRAQAAWNPDWQTILIYARRWIVRTDAAYRVGLGTNNAND